MKFVVTGGLGFIGSHLVDNLLRGGNEVVVIDDLSLGREEYLPNSVEFHNSVAAIYSVKDVDAIFHLGMPSSSPMYKENNHLISEVIRDFITLAKYAIENEAKLIFASTSSLYNGNPLPWREDMPILVTDFYTEARYYIERLAQLYNELYGLNYVGLRLFSVFGPREQHKGKFANLISQFIWDAIKETRPMVFGDGSQSRDFIYFWDVVSAFKRAFNYPHSGIFNVGSGKRHSLNEVMRLIEEVSGKKLNPQYVENPIKNYVYHTQADTTKAERELGFSISVPLRDGIEETFLYYLELFSSGKL